MCGGTSEPAGVTWTNTGLSPRVRGNLSGWTIDGYGTRSIPACAGEPPGIGKEAGRGAVYPRVCGGTCVSLAANACERGLSPRVRGNLLRIQRTRVDIGSIPACAGEPRTWTRSNTKNKVYPRVCGGTHTPVAPRRPAKGLSPRVRGNHAAAGDRVRLVRSIPACAGEPGTLWPSRPSATVYPCVCGGTRSGHVAAVDSPGLSPRVRGNRKITKQHSISNRSIPACAGEP